MPGSPRTLARPPASPREPPQAHGHQPPPRAIRRAFLDHFRAIGLAPHPHLRPVLTKPTVRALYAAHRAERDRAEAAFVRYHAPHLLHFADGREVDPARVAPHLVPVASGTDEAALFRVATRLWSVPLSRGFGRRLRYLVRDNHNGKLVGLLALGSPVFNLAARDADVGWTARDREVRLTRVMDAYVLGAVEPYASLLGGKLVGSLVGSAEIAADFAAKYDGAVASMRQNVITNTSSSEVGVGIAWGVTAVIAVGAGRRGGVETSPTGGSALAVSDARL